MADNMKAIEALTLQNALSENTKLISDCLEVSNLIYSNLTGDNRVNETQKEINCMIEQTTDQTEKLKNLLDILISIKTNMFC